MRKLVALAAAVLMLSGVWTGAAAARRKSAGKKSASKTASASKGGKKTSAPKSSTPKTTWRNRQTAPTPDRYREIQHALSAKGYLRADQVTGRWSDESADAMKRFQADQKLEASGKINSLSLIALGLGPKHDAPEAPAKPAAPGTADKPVQ